MTDSIPFYIGQSVSRREDRRLLLGEGAFISDMKLAGMVHVAIARSQYAHARIRSVDITAAAAAEGVALALSGGEQMVIAERLRRESDFAHHPVVVGEVELIEADLEVLPPVPNAEAALVEGAPLVHDHLPGNLAASLHASKGDGAAALEATPHRLRRRFDHHRYGGPANHG